MAFISYTPAPVGLVGVTPAWAYLDTTDSLTTITAAGYLNSKIGNLGLLDQIVSGTMVLAKNTIC